MLTLFLVSKTRKKINDLVPEFKNMYSDIDKSDGPTKAKRARKNKETIIK